MKVVAEADEKKRKKMMPKSAGSGSSSGAPPKCHMVYTPPRGQLRRAQQQQNWGNHSEFQPCPYSTATVGYHQAATAVSCQQLSMLQLWEDGPLCSIMPPDQAKQLTASSDTCGQLAEGPLEGACTTDGPRQLLYQGGDSHGRRSASGYVLPQRTSRYYSI
jgi:hypothetical protein